MSRYLVRVDTLSTDYPGDCVIFTTTEKDKALSFVYNLLKDIEGNVYYPSEKDGSPLVARVEPQFSYEYEIRVEKM